MPISPSPKREGKRSYTFGVPGPSFSPPSPAPASPVPLIVALLRKHPSGANAPYPGRPQKAKTASVDLQPLDRGAPWVFPPVRPPYVLPQLPDLG